MASGLRLTYICLSWTFSVTQSKGHSGLATFYGIGFGTCGWEKYTQAVRNKESNTFLYIKKKKSKSDNNFRKSVMICQITGSVDNHFGEYL